MNTKFKKYNMAMNLGLVILLAFSSVRALAVEPITLETLEKIDQGPGDTLDKMETILGALDRATTRPGPLAAQSYWNTMLFLLSRTHYIDQLKSLSIEGTVIFESAFQPEILAMAAKEHLGFRFLRKTLLVADPNFFFRVLQNSLRLRRAFALAGPDDTLKDYRAIWVARMKAAHAFSSCQGLF